MKTSTQLYIYIADNGGPKARALVCKEAKISQATLRAILNDDHLPRFEVRYRIFKLTGVCLDPNDDFCPEKLNAG